MSDEMPTALNLPMVDPLPAATQKYFDVCQDKLGLIPNVLKAHAFDIDKLNTFTALYNNLMLDASNLSKLEREMIAVAVSSANRCYYCLVAHGQAVRALSGEPELGEMLAFNYRVADLPARQRAMLDFSWKLSQTPQDIAEEDREALRCVGFSDEDIFDICDVAAFFNYTNRVAHGTDMMPNGAYHAMNR